MSGIVLDASAVLAVLYKEDGAEVVIETIQGEPNSLISMVNLSEILEKFMGGQGADAAMARRVVAQFQMTEIPFDGHLAMETALLRNRFQKSGLSFADCACIALARQRGLPVVTADRLWSRLELGVEVKQIRGRERVR